MLGFCLCIATTNSPINQNLKAINWDLSVRFICSTAYRKASLVQREVDAAGGRRDCRIKGNDNPPPASREPPLHKGALGSACSNCSINQNLKAINWDLSVGYVCAKNGRITAIKPPLCKGRCRTNVRRRGCKTKENNPSVAFGASSLYTREP